MRIEAPFLSRSCRCERCLITYRYHARRTNGRAAGEDEGNDWSSPRGGKSADWLPRVGSSSVRRAVHVRLPWVAVSSARSSLSLSRSAVRRWSLPDLPRFSARPPVTFTGWQSLARKVRDVAVSSRFCLVLCKKKKERRRRRRFSGARERVRDRVYLSPATFATGKVVEQVTATSGAERSGVAPAAVDLLKRTVNYRAK